MASLFHLCNMKVYFFIPSLIICLFTPSYSHSQSVLTPSEIYSLAERCSFELLVNGRLEGTGFIVSKDGYAITVLHALKEKAKLEIRSPQLGRLSVRHIGQCRGDDSALLKLPCNEEGYPYFNIADSPPAPGDEIFLIGTPIFRNRVFINGNVAGEKSVFEYYNQNYNEVIHVSAITAKGCSGGPWINQNGEVTGMQAANITVGNVLQGIASMIPPDRLAKLLERKETLAVPTLEMAVEGIWEQAPKTITTLPQGTRGLVIKQVLPKGVAAQKGIQDGDILTKTNNHQFEEPSDFIQYLRYENKMNKIQLEIMDSKSHQMKVVSITPKALL